MRQAIMIAFPATAIGLLLLGVVVGTMDNCTNEALADEKYEDEPDPYLARGGMPMSAEEKKSCENLELLPVGGIYFGNTPMRWRAANECCKLKGLVLLSHPTRHVAAIEKLKINWYFYDGPWVGTNDILMEGQYDWATGETVYSTSTWSPGEPNNGGTGNRHCAQIRRDGIMDGLQCDTQMRFLCEDLPPRGGVRPRPDELKMCESIRYEETLNGFRKQRYLIQNTGASWPLAAACCRAKGWELASLSDLSTEEEAELANLLSVVHEPYWTSGSNIESEGFVWDSSNDIISRDSRLWDQYSPQSLYNGRHCVQVMRMMNLSSVAIRDISCNVKRRILCKAETYCKATDTVAIVTKPGPNRFEFNPTATLARVMKFRISLERDLSPSRVTSLNWTLVWQTFYSEQTGVNPIAFKPSELEPPKQLEACITTFHVWNRYVATCKSTDFIYIAPEVVTAQNVTALCRTANNCVKSPSPCDAKDRWIHIATHENQELKLEDKSIDRPCVKNRNAELRPCFDFTPPTDPQDFLNAFLYREFTKLNPSPSTGVNWAEYYQNVTTGIPAEDYVVYGDDVPPGTFMNIYRVVGNCGSYKTDIPVYKLVLFSSDNPSGNCLVAKRENVPLEGC